MQAALVEQTDAANILPFVPHSITWLILNVLLKNETDDCSYNVPIVVSHFSDYPCIFHRFLYNDDSFVFHIASRSFMYI